MWRAVMMGVVGLVLAAGIGAAKEPAVVGGVPEGWKVVWESGTLEGLVKAAKPVAVFESPRGEGETMFLWTGVGKTGVRWFRVATARRVKMGRTVQWAIVRRDGGLLEDGEGWLPVEESAVKATVPGRMEMGTFPWAHVVTSVPGKGTVYEIEVYFQSVAEAAQGYRVVVMEDGKGAWKYVGWTAGDYWDDTGFLSRTVVAARLTEKAETPVEMVATYLNEQVELETGERQGRSGATLRYSGKLPFGSPTVREDYVEVMKGDTVSKFVKDLVEAEWDVSHRVDGRALVMREVMRLNPGMRPEGLRVGQRVRVPSPLQVEVLLLSPAG